ncbi:MAG: hypothetical protein K2X66_17255 [Cyanobacteria bacterium]|nr:hypothetical protein [Cyanobacteriota bacterium]
MQIHELFKDLFLGVHPNETLIDASRESATWIASSLEDSRLISSPVPLTPSEQSFPPQYSHQSYTDKPATPQSVSSRHLSKVLQNAFNEEGQKSLWQLDFAELKLILENTQAAKLTPTQGVSLSDQSQEDGRPSSRLARCYESSESSQEAVSQEPLTIEWIIQTAQRRYEDDSLKGKAVMPHCYVIQQMGPLGKTLFPDFMKKLKRRLNSQVQSKVKTLKMNLTHSSESI